MVDNDHLPDYSVELENELVTFTNKNFNQMGKWYNPDYANSWESPPLNPATYEKVRNITPKFDVNFFLEDEWMRFWSRTGELKL